MRSILRVTTAMSVLTLTGVMASASPVAANATSTSVVVGILSPQDASVVRGTQVQITGLTNENICSGLSDATGWWLDGHALEVQDATLPSDQQIVTNPPDLPADTYLRSDSIWDTSAVPSGTHTLTFWSTATGCNYTDITRTVSETVVVNNAPIGLTFSDPQGSVLQGASHQLSVTAEPQGSPVTKVHFAGDLVPAAQADDNLAPYTAMLDVFDAHNGQHTVTATAQDAAGVVTTSSLTVAVLNVSKLSISGPKRLHLADTITLHLANATHLRGGQPLLIQQKVRQAWVTVQKVTLPSSGKLAVSNGFTTTGRKYLRVLTASSNFWPGTSNVYTVVVT